MRILYPLAFVEIGALARHVFHVARIDQTRLDAVLFQHVVNRNPVHSGGFHRRCGHATTHQPFRHLVRIDRERRALADGMVIPVRRHGYVDLSGSDIDAGRIRVKYRTIRLIRILPLFGLLAADRDGSGPTGGKGPLTCLRHCISPWVGQTARPRKD